MDTLTSNTNSIEFIDEGLEILNKQKQKGLFRLSYYTLRPLGIPAATLILVMLWRKHLINKITLFLSTALLLNEWRRLLVDRYVFSWRDWIKRPKIGLIHYSPTVTDNKENIINWENCMKKILLQTNFGDLNTMVASIMYACKNPTKWKRYVTENNVEVDFEFPINSPLRNDKELLINGIKNLDIVKQQNFKKLAIILPGLEGGSLSGYAMETANYFTENGDWTVCVVNARGMGNAHKTKIHVSEMYNPANLDSLYATLIQLLQCFDIAVLIGFSLGGLATNRILSYYHHTRGVPKNLLGGISFSGSFSIDFMLGVRYKKVYQSFIVPSILENLIKNHRDTVLKIFGYDGFSYMLESNTYLDLHRYFFQPLSEKYLIPTTKNNDTSNNNNNNNNSKYSKGGPLSFDTWKENMESVQYKQYVDRPLVLVAAHDDPLHEISQIGVNGDVKNPFIAYYLTRVGGHISFPPYPQWMVQTSYRFAESLVKNIHHQD